MTTERRVAVLAFHGVADQKPNETAQAIAGMLLGLPEKDGIRYSDFKQSELRLPVGAVIPDRPEESVARVDSGEDEIHSRVLSQLHQKDKGQSAAARRITGALERGESIVQAEERTAPDTLDHQYMREQLEQYRPAVADRAYNTSDSVYETIQLSGFRAKGGNKTCEVHLFEMYWADLSRVSSDVLRVLVDFYQLIGYLCGIGRKTLAFARAAMPYSLSWGWFAGAQWWSERTLTQFVPGLNLCLLGLVVATLLPFQVSPKAYPNAAIAVVGVATAVIVAGLLYVMRRRFSAKGWPFLVALVLLATALGAAGALWFHAAAGDYAFYSTLSWLAWLVFGVIVFMVMKAYDRRVVGARVAGMWCVCLVSVVYGLELWAYRGAAGGIGNRIAAASAETAGLNALVLVSAWYLYSLLALVTSIAGECVARRAGADRDAARRAVWTVNLTLLLPGTLTLIANLAVWKAFSIGLHRCPGFHDPALILRDGGAPVLTLGSRIFHTLPSNTTLGVLDNLITCFASGWFPLFFICFGLAALLAVWSILPAITSNNAPDQAEEASTWLGQSLSSGFRAMRVSGELIRLVVLAGSVLMLFVLVMCYRSDANFFEQSPAWLRHPSILSVLGLILWSMLVASQGRLRFLALGFRSAIDIALDVANWLRLHPRDANPKARISARCVSQLEYLAAWRDPRDGGAYDAFVIIAHSQGSIISTELLRFLQVEKHRLLRQLGDRKIYLFTMGCPLRQLYSLRFPHQYAWARHNSAAWAGEYPDPAHLGIAQWVNAYRSGDYVGRYLWHPDTGDDQWKFRDYADKGNNSRREFCIGPGDHTHYWDKTAPAIAKELDRLIGDACSQSHPQDSVEEQVSLANPENLTRSKTT